MFRTYIGLFCLTFILSCNCQKTIKKVDTSDTDESSKIMAYIRQKNFEIIENAEVVLDLEIKKTLIEGTTDEYSNKVFLKDTLPAKEANLLLGLLKKDASYNWNFREEPENFEPGRQFLIKGSMGRLVILFDERETILGFINLDGQKLLQPSVEFSSFLKKL